MSTSSPIDHNLAAYMAAVAAALESVPPCKVTYGEFFVGRAVIEYDGEETGYAVVADEHGGYAIEVPK